MRQNSAELRYGGFSLRILTRCGTPLLAGGLCKAGYEQQSGRDLLALASFDFRDDGDIYDIDARLAQAVRECCGSYILAAGVTADIPDIPFRTGGVVGSPHMESSGADGRVHTIGHGICLRAFPGGPGCAAVCEKSVLECWDYNAYPPGEKAEALAQHLRAHGVKPFFVLTDGAGPDARGSFILETGGQCVALNF